MAHALRSGELNRRITIQQRDSEQNTFGQQLLTWSDVLICWAGIEQMQGRELEMAQAINAETTHRVTIRYRAGITPAMRVLYQGRVLNVLSVLDIDTAHVALHLMCSGGLNQG